MAELLAALAFTAYTTAVTFLATVHWTLPRRRRRPTPSWAKTTWRP